MKAEESVPAVRYLWVDQNLDLLSVEEEEAETGIRADTAMIWDRFCLATVFGYGFV